MPRRQANGPRWTFPQSALATPEAGLVCLKREPGRLRWPNRPLAKGENPRAMANGQTGLLANGHPLEAVHPLCEPAIPGDASDSGEFP